MVVEWKRALSSVCSMRHLQPRMAVATSLSTHQARCRDEVVEGVESERRVVAKGNGFQRSKNEGNSLIPIS